MQSIQQIFKSGYGPSSSHTMGPRKAAEKFIAKNPNAAAYRVTLFSSLALTGKGHRTDDALERAFASAPLEIIWEPQASLPFHPNGMRFSALDENGNISDNWEVYSIGGGEISEGEAPETETVYPFQNMKQILEHCERSGQSLWEIVEEYEGENIWPYLQDTWEVMQAALARGLAAEGVIAGGLGLARKAWAFHQKSKFSGKHLKPGGTVFSYALAVSEENAEGGKIVTAPTCGSCGVLPAVLKFLLEKTECSERSILRAMATAGLVGNLIKHNASISGAEVGCQGEIGSACAMAAAAAAQLMGSDIRQIEYAAEMGLEHHLGLTCDPVGGMVQIPCIERNAFAAKRALDCAEYALFAGGTHRISFDNVVEVMKQTGHDLPSLYRETASGGLAAAYNLYMNDY